MFADTTVALHEALERSVADSAGASTSETWLEQHFEETEPFIVDRLPSERSSGEVGDAVSPKNTNVIPKLLGNNIPHTSLTVVRKIPEDAR